MPRSKTDSAAAGFTQAEIIALSGRLISAVTWCEQRCAVHRWADAEADRRAGMLAEMRELRDALSVIAPTGPVAVDALFATAS